MAGSVVRMEQHPTLRVAEKNLPSSWAELPRGDFILGSNIYLWAPGPGQGHSPSVCQQVQRSELVQEP